ncbi:alcohol dehydrogenase catalytic domain-containing protein [Aestuariicella hydrocarbonica]|uniref:Alcohol dehydrogenase catalytic domain-containing protein n=1 Tax=Pseudomaricurvus hydrocarbonicus TaxID=1470433 RepID=A0A9E5JW70_9GAMM|nr:alcohol dehydrogenase catalytic domain-containing protein [Aestuariicella hydrocarbonica]NHO65655.1 alcohol dehydrogenase catalytic domain-containing protein [Aestuariicella hydrocarbonica]
MGTEHYKAAIYRDKGCVDVVELPYPQCGDEDVIIKNLLAGVCGTDIAAYKNGDPRPVWKDSEFGHEVVSEVVEVGKNVQGLVEGDWVFPNLGNAIRNRKRMSNVGAFSEYLKLPQCEVGFSVLKISKDIPIKTAVLLEPFMVGARGVVGLNPGPGKTAIVFGAGIIGMSAAIMLKWYGCDKVMIVDVSDFRLKNAEKFDVVTCNAASQDLKSRAIEEFGSQAGLSGECCGADIYVDALSLTVAIDNFTMLAKRDAHLAILGVHHEPVPMDLKSVCYNNWHIHGCGNTPNESISQDVFNLMESGKYDLSSLVTHEYKIENICDALMMGRNSSEAQKVCISYL